MGYELSDDYIQYKWTEINKWTPVESRAPEPDQCVNKNSFMLEEQVEKKKSSKTVKDSLMKMSAKLWCRLGVTLIHTTHYLTSHYGHQ